MAGGGDGAVAVGVAFRVAVEMAVPVMNERDAIGFQMIDRTKCRSSSSMMMSTLCIPFDLMNSIHFSTITVGTPFFPG